MVNQSYKKSFDDLETAFQFGEEVDSIAEAIMVTAGSAGKRYPIFSTYSESWDVENIGKHHIVTKDVGTGNKDIYHVEYRIRDPRGSLRSDVLEAQRQAESYLDEKYAEIGPNTGVSRV